MNNLVKRIDLTCLRSSTPLGSPKDLRKHISNNTLFKTKIAGDSVWFDYSAFEVEDWLNVFAIVKNSKQAYKLMRRTVEEAKKIDSIDKKYANLYMQIKAVFIENGIWQVMTKKEMYKRMSNEDLENAVMSYGLNPSNLIKADPSLYTEINSPHRRHVRRNLADLLGWRRPKTNWKRMTDEEWCDIASQYHSLSQFSLYYKVAYTKSCTLGKIDFIKKEMVRVGRWIDKVGLDGIYYDSESEMAVANWLFLSGHAYKAHPKIGLRSTSKESKADFMLSTGGHFVEVWAFHPKKSRKEHLPIWAEYYLDKRRKKEQYYRDHGLSLISIEAEYYRTGGTSYYLKHVKQQFNSVGLKLSDSKPERIMRQSRARGLSMTVEEVVNLCIELGFEYSSHLLCEGYSDIYNGIKGRGLLYELTLALDKVYGRVSACPRDPDKRPEIDDLRRACTNLGIKYKKEYENAYKKGMLPQGSPSNVRQTYGINWQEFITGRGRFDFLSFKEARQLVRSLGLKSKAEFHLAIKNKQHPLLDKVRKSPGNRVSGGYPEWEGWDDFLGKT